MFFFIFHLFFIN